MKKQHIVLLAVATILIIAGVFGFLYFSPKITIDAAKAPQRAEAETFYVEPVNASFSSRLELFGIDIPSKTDSLLSEITNDSSAVIKELRDNYISPIKVTTTLTKDGGVVTMRCSGTATSSDGETVDFLREFTYDFGVLTDITLQ